MLDGAEHAFCLLHQLCLLVLLLLCADLHLRGLQVLPHEPSNRSKLSCLGDLLGISIKLDFKHANWLLVRQVWQAKAHLDWFHHEHHWRCIGSICWKIGLPWNVSLHDATSHRKCMDVEPTSHCRLRQTELHWQSSRHPGFRLLSCHPFLHRGYLWLDQAPRSTSCSPDNKPIPLRYEHYLR